MPTQLVVVAGPDKGQSFPLALGVPLIVGRGANTLTRLVDLHVSRMHCEVTWDGSRAVVKDNNSVGGTFVNNQRVGSAELRAGDILRIGETEMRFVCDVAEEQTLPPEGFGPEAVAAAMRAAAAARAASAPAPTPATTAPTTVAKAPATAPAPTTPAGATSPTAPSPAPPPATAAAKTVAQPALPARTVAHPPRTTAAPALPTSSPAPPAAPPAFTQATPTASRTTAAPAPTPAAAPELVLAKRVGGPPLAPWAKQLHALVGKAIGRYELQRVLGTGTVGVVFLAKNTADQKLLALKVFRPDFTRDEKSMQRFLRGMKTVIGFSHPHLVNLYNAGLTQPYCWIAMEYVEGESVAEILRKPGAARPEWQRAWRIAFHIAHALDYIHERGVIHRNVLPHNVMVRHADQAAKLGDVMLAKALEGNAAQEVTESGEIVGNLYYMAPERTLSNDDIDGRADIYSLGATLYHFLTGKLPFQGNNIIEIMGKIRQTPPLSPRQFNPNVPEVFEQVLLRMMAKKPEQRYATAKDLLSDLAKISKVFGVQ